MHLVHMFPKKTLDAQDFIAALGHGRHPLTIEHIYDKEFEKNGQPEIVFYIKFAQFKKAIKLNMSNAYAIGDALGTQETEEWIGKHVEVVAYQKSITENTGGRPTKKMIWIFDILPEPTRLKALPFMDKDITHACIEVKKGERKPAFLLALLPSTGTGTTSQDAERKPGTIGVQLALKMMDGIHTRGMTIEKVLVSVNAQNATVHQGCIGKPPPEWPQAALAIVSGVLQDMPKSYAPMNETAKEALVRQWTTTVEVIDPNTGEVLNKPAKPAKPAEIPIEDIPF